MSSQHDGQVLNEPLLELTPGLTEAGSSEHSLPLSKETQELSRQQLAVQD